MSLAPLKFMLDSQLSRCEQHFYSALALAASKDRYLRVHHFEGALSDAWQAYCTFVRYVLIRSSIGSVTASGVVLAPSVAPAIWERVSHIASKTSAGARVQVGGVNNLLIKEPTWGDSSKVLAIISALAPANSTTLQNYLGGGLLGPKHCQIVRNACAHRNTQTRATVDALASLYVATRVKHPTDAMLWKDSSTGQYSFLSWLDDMKAIAEGAVS